MTTLVTPFMEEIAMLMAEDPATTEATAKTVSMMMDLLPLLMMMIVGFSVITTIMRSDAFSGSRSGRRRVPSTPEPEPRTLKDDLRDAKERYVNGEIAEYRLEQQLEEAYREHQEIEERPSRLQEELEHER